MTSSPEHISQSPEAFTLMETIAIDNIRVIETVGPSTAFGTLWCVNPATGKATQGLEGPCDPINRQMLDSVYARAGIDVSEPIRINEKETSDGRKYKLVVYRAKNGVEISEIEASQGDWHVFKATYSPLSKLT